MGTATVTAVASIENRGGSLRVIWRNDGRKTTFPCVDDKMAGDVKALVDARRGRLTRGQVDEILFGARDDTSAVPTLRDWVPIWLASRTRIGRGQRQNYANQFANVILPALGHHHLDRITPTMVGALINGIRQNGRSPGTATRYFSALHACLAGAVAENLIDDNPAQRTDFVRDQIAEDDEGVEDRVYLTPAQYDVLLTAFRPADRPFIRLLAGTGARWGEATALRVSDLAPRPKASAPKVRIWRAWKYGENGKRYLGTTKGRQRRDVEVDDQLHQELCLAAVRHLEDGTWKVRGDDEWLFLAPRGGILVHSNYLHRVWEPTLIRARRCPQHPPVNQAAPAPSATGTCGDHGGRRTRGGAPCSLALAPGLNRCSRHLGPLPRAVSDCDCPDVLHVAPTPHDLRHSHAAWLFANPDVPTLAISRRLGHANLKTTSEIYGGLAPSAEAAAVTAIAAVTAAAGRGPASA